MQREVDVQLRGVLPHVAHRVGAHDPPYGRVEFAPSQVPALVEDVGQDGGVLARLRQEQLEPLVTPAAGHPGQFLVGQYHPQQGR